MTELRPSLIMVPLVFGGWSMLGILLERLDKPTRRSQGLIVENA